MATRALLSAVHGRDTILMVHNKPVFVCVRCGKYATDLKAATCSERTASRARCNGTLRSALGPDDWKQCFTCSGSGAYEGTHCIPCQGTGWRFVRYGR